MTTHTAGPWKAEETYLPANNLTCHWISDKDRNSICSMVIRDITGELEKANAALIAAAPDLLDALESVSQLLPVAPMMHPDDLMALQNRVLSAISKAKGGD